jgi:acetyl-CoA carboxylase, biotin carboxylase subunit
MFDKILIANRGEVALRILRACKELGIPSVAVHSTADEDAMHVRLADESVCIGPPAARDSYLNVPALLSACEITGADAVHPGYGFLSENARFAEILHEHDIHFIGPKPAHIRLMGDKIEARRTAKRLGIPVVPGSENGVSSDQEAASVAQSIGFPLLVKAAAGGGGRGMKLALDESQLEPALQTARTEAKAAFGDSTVYLEKYLVHPRHIEVQVLADGQGNAIHLGERDCSLQRRHQKLWEEAPSPALNESERVRIGETVAHAMRTLRYRGVGTVEFLYEAGQFYFIEMNTRLQVEHGVTEMVTGIDLVRAQLLIAAAQELEFAQDDIRVNGSAIEFRINAEDPAQDFHPSPGRIDVAELPGGFGVRVDTAIYAGYTVVPFYDSLIAKLMVWAPTREQALRRGRRALREFRIEGIATTVPLHMRLVDDERVRSGEVHTGYLEQLLSEGDAAAGLAAQVSSVNRDGEANE